MDNINIDNNPTTTDDPPISIQKSQKDTISTSSTLTYSIANRNSQNRTNRTQRGTRYVQTNYELGKGDNITFLKHPSESPHRDQFKTFQQELQQFIIQKFVDVEIS